MTKERPILFSGAMVGGQTAADRVLTIPMKGIYFDQIKAGTKPREYRLITDYWRKRLEGRTYDRIVLTRGYPKADEHARRLDLPWFGYEVQTITHPHFGDEPVRVFAINVTGCPPWLTTKGRANVGAISDETY